MTRRPLIAANWKMYKTAAEAVAYAADFVPRVRDIADVDVVLAPPFPALPALVDALADLGAGRRIAVAAQNVHAEPRGAFTGEVSLPMLAACGATFVIVGHSERRRLFGETDAGVNAKTRAAAAAGMTSIVCVGETLEEREADRTFDVLDRQVAQGLADLSPAQAKTVVVAYEPVWAIGTGRVAAPAQADAAHRRIRARLAALFGGGTADACRIIYGGSVKPGNAAELMAQPDVDGALVGGASLDAAAFAEIVAASRPSAGQGSAP